MNLGIKKKAGAYAFGAGKRASLFDLLAHSHVAFTMAEILLSLTIIGVVAAITLPSLTGNINERTWNTQRKALYSRMSQAVALMPAMNRYGVGADDTATANNATETFLTNGLAKVLKMNNICNYGTDGSTLQDCGLPAQIVNAAGSKVNLPTKISSLNGGITGVNSPVSIINTKAAAFETGNGESILAFYNPNCLASNVEKVSWSGETEGEGTKGYASKQYVCLNLIYDLNGKKGPNTMGKDIGTMAVFYPSDSKVVMPMYLKKISGTKTHVQAAQACTDLDDGQYRLPNVEELISIYYNQLIYGESVWTTGERLWSSTLVDATHAYTVGNSYGNKYSASRTDSWQVICVQR